MFESSPRRRFIAGMFTAGAAAAPAAAAPQTPSGALNVRDFGAVPDGVSLTTAALQQAIDACARAGGGTVYFPAGRYLSGTLFLKSRVTVHLAAGATLVGSKNLSDYPVTVAALRSYTDNYTDKSLIYAENVEDVAIHGRGAIDGQGAAFKGPYKVRPYMIRVINCRNVSVRDLTIVDSPMWVQHYLACENVIIDGIAVHSRVNGNNDGIDIDGCQKVRIANCEISSGDDAIVLKSTLDRPCRDVSITNCVLSTACNALKLGTESNGGFENIVISNCTIYDTRLSGIALELVDGGVEDRVIVSNITMNNVSNPIFIRLGNRARPFQEGGARPGMGKLRNIIISNVLATGADGAGCSITGLAGHPAENITLENIRLSFRGGGTRKDAAREVPEEAEKYPEYQMFGVLPAYGFYCRHVRDLTLRNVHTAFATPDERPALVADDVENLKLLQCDGFTPPAAGPAIRLVNVKGAFVHGCRAPAGTRTFLRVEGAATANVCLMANDLSAAEKAVETADGVRREAVILEGNRGAA